MKILVFSLWRWLAQSSRSSSVLQGTHRTLLLDTLAGHSCLTPFARHYFLTLLLITLSGHSSLVLLQGHSCATLLKGHSCWTFLLDTLAGHSLLTLLLDTLDTTFLLDTLAGHSYLTLLLDTPAGHSWHTWQDTPARHFLQGHSCWTLLQDTPPRHSCWTLFAWHSCLTLLLDTLAWHSCLPLLSGHSCKPDKHFPRDFHQKWHSNLPKRAFYTRLSSKVTIQASKTSVLHKTFTKSDNPSFQNERFTRDFHHKWQSKLPKRAFYTRLSPKVTSQASKTSVLHETSRKSELRSNRSASQIPMEQRDSTPVKHHSETANPNGTTTQTCHFHETLRLCSEITVFNLQVYDVLRLPRKMNVATVLKTSKIVALPSAWNDFDHFHSHTLSSKLTFYLRPVTQTELFTPPCNCKSQWNSAIQHL